MIIIITITIILMMRLMIIKMIMLILSLSGKMTHVDATDGFRKQCAEGILLKRRNFSLSPAQCFQLYSKTKSYLI